MRIGPADSACVPGINRGRGAGSSARGAEAPGNGAGSGFAADSGGTGPVPGSAAARRRDTPSSGVRTGNALVGQNGSELLAQPVA